MSRFAYLAVGLVLCLAPVAEAGPRVPEVPADQLPVAGTCAPIDSAHLTWLTLGVTDRSEVDWYRINEDPRDQDGSAVGAYLAQQAEAARAVGGKVDVWIVAGRDRRWGQVVIVLAIYKQNGIFRVGLQVRSESGDGLMGFPLFLPPPTAGLAGSSPEKARLLEVRVIRPVASLLKKPTRSDFGRLYAAASRAAEQTGPIVADASIRRDVAVQDAARILDLLYRAGCAAVRLPVLIMGDPRAQPFVEISVQGRLLPADRIDVDLPAAQPRRTPWPDHGATQPGAYAWTLEPIPTKGDLPPEVAARLKPLPNYAASGKPVPPGVMVSTETTIKKWGESLGRWLTRALGPPPVNLPETLLVRRKRQGLGAVHFFRESRQVFRNPEAVTAGTVRFLAYLVQGTTPVGRVDVTLSLTGDGVGVVFASWTAESVPADLILPPHLTDPFAPGIPGYFRIWLEGTLTAARLRGAVGVPLATEAEVLAQMPTVAHPSVRAALSGRLAAINHLVGWLRATHYDRVFVAAAEGTAAVRQGGRVTGILRFNLEGERGELSMATLKPRVAPR